MNQVTNAVAVVVVVAAQSDEMVKTNQIGYTSTKMVDKVEDVFNLALHHATYMAPHTMFDEANFANGTGYYDPLMTVGFVDEEGNPVPKFSSVALVDLKTNRRLYLIVLDHGRNIIVHDRFSQTPTSKNTTLVATGDAATRLLNLSSCWSENTHDLVQAATIFGLEYDKRSNSVYVPMFRKVNWFQANASLLVA